ncbi:MAG: putative baseplate assembly protein, partial [Chloroflexota bacterium]
LALLQTRPLGIRGVTNPLPASGAAAPEHLAEARANAPLTVLTLDRIVSLRDFEDFARAFAGIGKAQAVTLWNGQANLAHVTIAGTGGDPVDPRSPLFTNLRQAIDAVRDPVQQVHLDSFEPQWFGIAASLLIDPRYVAADVLAGGGAALREAFAFEQRAFGQAVTAAEAITVLQGVSGVQAVDLDGLFAVPAPGAPPPGPLPGSPPPFLPAATASWEAGEARPAQLLLIDPAAITLTELRPAT